ncbi:MAG: hypothetical protein ACLS3M_06980 [Collinsella sp.]
MAQQPQGKHMEVKHMDDSDKKRRATILKGVFVVLLLVAVGCGGYVLYMNHLEQQRAEEMSATGKPATKVESKGKELPDNPIDSLRSFKRMPISMRGSTFRVRISTPLLRARRTTCLSGPRQGRQCDPYGTAFSQMANARDFSDPSR